MAPSLEERINDLEARVLELEGNKKSSKKSSKKTGKSSKKSTKATKKKKKKKKPNEFFKKMIEAKRKGLPSFEYNDNTYTGTKHATLGMVYKKA